MTPIHRIELAATTESSIVALVRRELKHLSESDTAIFDPPQSTIDAVQMARTQRVVKLREELGYLETTLRILSSCSTRRALRLLNVVSDTLKSPAFVRDAKQTALANAYRRSKFEITEPLRDTE